MKRILLAVLLLTTTSAWAEWVQIGSSSAQGGSDAYADLTTIRRTGDLVKMWALYDYKTAQVTRDGKRYLSTTAQEEFDCKVFHKRHRSLSGIFYSGQMGGGRFVVASSKPSNWTPNVPGSIGERLGQKACRQEFEWAKVSRSADRGGFDVYADTAKIRRTGDMVDMWDMKDYKTAQVTRDGKRHRSASVLNHYDCKDKRSRQLYVALFSGQMRVGNIYFSPKVGGWRPIAPNSIGEVLWKYACAKK